MTTRDEVEYLLYTDPDSDLPSMKSSSREGAELWAARFERRTGRRPRLVRRRWYHDDVELELRDLED